MPIYEIRIYLQISIHIFLNYNTLVIYSIDMRYSQEHMLKYVMFTDHLKTTHWLFI